jgi:taurine dioxygenase
MSDPAIAIPPLDPVGAEVSGLEGLEEFSSGTARALNEAWWRHGILLFRNVRTAQQHIALSRCFGELEVHPLKELRAPENPLFFPLGGDRVMAQVYDDRDLLVNRIPWHRDTAFTTGMCMGAMLRMVEAPDTMGETLIGDTAAAYDALPDDIKQRIETLEYRGSQAEASMGVINAGA